MDPVIITFITASTALIAASPIVSISITRRQFKASVIANNREKWIEALREAIANHQWRAKGGRQPFVRATCKGAR